MQQQHLYRRQLSGGSFRGGGQEDASQQQMDLLRHQNSLPILKGSLKVRGTLREPASYLLINIFTFFQLVNQDRDAFRKSASYKHPQQQHPFQHQHQRTASDSSKSAAAAVAAIPNSGGGSSGLSRSHSIAASGSAAAGGGFALSAVRNQAVLVSQPISCGVYCSTYYYIPP